MTEEEFSQRFKERMFKRSRTLDAAEHKRLVEYAARTAPSYWRVAPDLPEECADEDMHCW